jgi:hypothetical protein
MKVEFEELNKDKMYKSATPIKLNSIAKAKYKKINGRWFTDFK